MANSLPPWRPGASNVAPSPFGAGNWWRPLTMIVDAAPEPDDAPLKLLRAFARHPGVEIWATCPGWDGGQISFTVGPNEVVQAIIRRESGETRHPFHCVGLEALVSEATASTQCGTAGTRRALCAAQFARKYAVDAIVATSAEYTVTGAQRRGLVVDSANACGLLGLYLRTHGDFTFTVNGNVWEHLDFERYYSHTAAAVINGWDWHHRGAIESVRSGCDVARPRLTEALRRRLGRALAQRDRVLALSTHWEVDRFEGEVREAFEAMLLSLVGALDVTARYVDHSLEMATTSRRVGFNSPSWHKALRQHHSSGPVADWVTDELTLGTPAQRCRRLLTTLRNVIHHDVLTNVVTIQTPAAQSVGWHGEILALHGTLVRTLREACRDDLAQPWGLRFEEPDVALVDIQKFQSAALRFVISTIESALQMLVACGTVPRVEPDPGSVSVRYATNLRLLAAIDSRVRYSRAPTTPPGFPT